MKRRNSKITLRLGHAAAAVSPTRRGFAAMVAWRVTALRGEGDAVDDL